MCFNFLNLNFELLNEEQQQKMLMVYQKGKFETFELFLKEYVINEEEHLCEAIFSVLPLVLRIGIHIFPFDKNQVQ
jgi:hypothetical protein